MRAQLLRFFIFFQSGFDPIAALSNRSLRGNHKMRGLLSLLFLSVVAWGQASTSSYAPGIDFGKYHTFQWAATHPHPDAQKDSKIRQAIESELAAKGLTKTESNPDLTLDYHVAISQKEQWTSFRFNELDTQTPRLITVYAGTLGLDIKDPHLNQVVWTGMITKALDPDNSKGAIERNLGTTVRNLLKGFPPKLRG